MGRVQEPRVCRLCGNAKPSGRERSAYCSERCRGICPRCCTSSRRAPGEPCLDCIARATYERRDRRCRRCGGKKTDRRNKQWFCGACSLLCSKCERPRVPPRGAGSKQLCSYHLWERQIARYGINAEQWEALFVSQGSRCAICKSDQPGRKPALIAENAWCTDHDHKTGLVRGILCQYCNKTLGHFGDSLQAMRKRLAEFESYLRKPSLFAGQRP